MTDCTDRNLRKRVGAGPQGILMVCRARDRLPIRIRVVAADGDYQRRAEQLDGDQVLGRGLRR